jgi:WD40 repeat protein
MIVAAGAAACGTAPSGDGEAAPPTFARATGASLAYEQPVASATDLIAPTDDASDGWTVVGSIFEPDAGRSVATVWTSEDGADWESATPASSGEDETISAATRTDDGIVAVGRVGASDEADAAVWTRKDGDWTVASPEALGGDHEQWAFDVASGPGGTLVAGGENVWGEIRPRLWFSADGTSWATVDGGPGGPFDGTGEETVRAIAAFGDGFVAVGYRSLDNEQDGITWYSADGETWEEVDAPALRGPGRQQVVSLASYNGGMVAGGSSDLDGDGRGDPVVWRTVDGRTWEGPSAELPMTDDRSGVRDRTVRSLSLSTVHGLIAAGGNDWRPRLWQSLDGGASWTELPDPVHGDLFQDGVALRAAAASTDVTVAIGGEPTVLRLAGPRWEDATGDAFPKADAQPFATSVTTDADGKTIAAGGLYTAASGETRERFVGQIWRRTGDGWDTIDSSTLAAGQVMDVVPFAGGYVAVGFEDFGLAANRENLTDALPDGLVWVSPNGTDWARIGAADAVTNEQYLQFLDDPSVPGLAAAIAQLETEAPPRSADPAGGDGTRSLQAVVPFGDGFISVGSFYNGEDGDPIILVSPDGTSFTAEAPPHSGPGTQLYTDVCVTPDGAPIAIGIGGATGAYDAIVAARVEGAGWLPGSGDGLAGNGDQQANACAASDDGFIMVGSDDSTGNRDARVWISEDGQSWTEVESSILGGTGDQWATAVAPAPDGGWLVAGTDTASGDGDIALWRIDADGELTRRDRGERALRGPGEQTVTSIDIEEDGHVILAGTDYGRVGLWESDSVDR